MGQITLELHAARSLAPGRYRVTVKINPNAYYLAGGSETINFDVVAPATVVDDRPEFVIVAVGDSYGSGEGNPANTGDHHVIGLPNLIGHPKTATSTEWWGADSDSQRCHRSDASGFAKAAAELQRRNPKLRIVFKSFACSGAAIVDGPTSVTVGGRLQIGRFGADLPIHQSSEPGGALQPYEGPEKRDPPLPKLPAQIKQINRWMEGRTNKKIDAMLVSLGGNDVGFGAVIFQCLVKMVSNCNEVGPAKGLFESRLAQLAGRFDQLDVSLRGQGSMPLNPASVPAKVYITEYPDPSRDQNGRLCDRTKPTDLLGDDVTLLSLSRDETRWIHEELVPELNGVVHATTRFGWVPVKGIVEAFGRHGICSTDRFINTNREAIAKQGADIANLPGILLWVSNGFVHPNNAGYAAIANRVVLSVNPQVAERARTQR